MKTYMIIVQDIIKYISFKIALLSLFLLLTSFSPGNYFNKQNPNKITNYPKEKIYIHFDKPSYISDEDIWFKVYLVDAITNQPKMLSKIVYVDLIDPNKNIIDSRTIKIENGGGAGEFRLTTKLHSGNYYIRAYTNSMRNFDEQFFFKKQFFIQSFDTQVNNSVNIDKNARPDMQFFPEGGYMINDIPCRLGYKTIGRNGKGIDITGTIVDENGKGIEKFKTSKFGLGRTLFVPEKDKTYKAHINYANQNFDYDLPKALNLGATIQVEDLSDHYQIIIRSTFSEGVNELVLLGKQEEKVVGRAKLSGSEKVSTIQIPKIIFKEGIVQFTLLDKNNKPICERLAFVEKEGQPIINTSFSKDHFQKRELVEMEVSFNKNIPRPDFISLSLSVTDMSIVHQNKFGLDIKSYMLLTSDLRGEIENTGYYFMSKDPERKELLDILMMTQGWRRYLLNEEPEKNHTDYKLEKGIYFSGTVKDINNRKKISSKVKLLLKNKFDTFHVNTETNDQRHFIFGPFNIADSTTFIIKILDITEKESKRHRKSQMKYYIEFDQFSLPKVSFNPDLSNDINTDIKNNYLKRSKAMRPKGRPTRNSDVHELDEIVLAPITIRKTNVYEVTKKNIGVRHSEASQLISSEVLENAAEGNLVSILQSRIPGLVINGDIITLRGVTTLLQQDYPKEPEKPLFLLDNIITDFENIRDLRVEIIDFVEVLKGSRAAIYGSRASHGVIAIYTKSIRGKIEEPSMEEADTFEVYEPNEIIRFVHPGYYSAREFYAPVYNSDEKDYSKPDYRTTIFWKPDIKFNTQGQTKIYFYSADIPTTYRIDLQGITSDGVPLRLEDFIIVK